MIAGTGYIKSANDESLARDEGGGRNLFMEVATYKTVQGRRLRMTPATANHFFLSVNAAVRRTAGLQRGAWGRLRRPSRKKNHKTPWVTTMKIPYRATSSAPKGDRPILEYTTKRSSPD